MHEEVFRGYTLEAIQNFEKEKPRGEFVIIIEGAKIREEDPYEDISIKEHLKLYVDEGLSKKDAVKKSI